MPGIMSVFGLLFALLPLFLLAWIGFRVHYILQELREIRMHLAENAADRGVGGVAGGDVAQP